VAEVTAAAHAAVSVFYAEGSPMEFTTVATAGLVAAEPGVGTLLEGVGVDYRRQQAEHVERVHRLIATEIDAAAKPRRRGARWQHGKRRLQQEIRQQTVACYHELRQAGHSREAVAEFLNLSPRTLRHWEDACGPDKIAVVPLGRPSARAAVPQRQQVLQFLEDQGPGVGVPALRERFPALTRAELTDLVQRYRHVCTVRWHESARVLHWPVVGRVWAMDFAAPSRPGVGGVLPPLDGRYPYLLAVRDLASGYQLCWLPVAAATAAVTCEVLAHLFAVHGKPLVVKTDNGPPFRADRTKGFLESAGVHFLFSPPYWPGYNGAIEATIGSLKSRTEQQAAGQGHAGHWTWADAAAACQQGNTSLPRRLHGLTPAEAWAGRTVITEVERVRFELAVAGQRLLARSEMGLGQEAALDHWQGSALDRKAIERALVEHAYLLYRGRRVPLTIKPGKVTFLV
jgi:transposase InsO family protein